MREGCQRVSRTVIPARCLRLPRCCCLCGTPEEGSSHHGYYWSFWEGAETCWEQFIFWLPEGVWLIVCLCSCTVSHQRAEISCLLFLETSFILPHVDTHWMFVGQLTAESRIQAEFMKAHLLPKLSSASPEHGWQSSYPLLLSPCELMLAMGDSFRLQQ